MNEMLNGFFYLWVCMWIDGEENLIEEKQIKEMKISSKEKKPGKIFKVYVFALQHFKCRWQ